MKSSILWNFFWLLSLYFVISFFLYPIIECKVINWKSLTPLPVSISNNVVTVIRSEDGRDHSILSFLGLTQDKTWKDVSSLAFEYSVQNGNWKSLPSVLPSNSTKDESAGRLGATAISIHEERKRSVPYIFGGYRVYSDKTEITTEFNEIFDTSTQKYSFKTSIPVPVDDSVSVVYKDRYIYLICGWHKTKSVNLVQVYDTHLDRWFNATTYPGEPVFGHAGALLISRIIVCDGVVGVSGNFQMSDSCYMGDISADDFTKITWMELPPHPGKPRYRMGSASTNPVPNHSALERILFIGGSENPYDYNGIGYNGVPSQPSSSVFSFNLNPHMRFEWVNDGDLPVPTMDHRSLAVLPNNTFVIVGGMIQNQVITNQVFSFQLIR